MADNFVHDVFLSYCRANMAKAKQLQQSLQDQGISVWRDQESIYGGQQWPKAIGEGIAAGKVFVLLWSEEAANSYFVEFEWNTALALKKVIIPVLLDTTGLPASLRAIHSIPYDDLSESTYLPNQLANIPPPDQEQQRAVIDKLSKLPDDASEKAVSEQAQQIFQQEGWKVQGNVYQIHGGNVTINGDTDKPSKTKKWYERWQAWLGALASIATILAFLWSVYGKPSESPSSGTEEKAKTLSVKGSVLTTNNQPVRGAIVKLNMLPGDSVVTTSDGGFMFKEVPGQVGEDVRVYVQATGYESRDQYQVLPGPIEIRLEEETVAN